MNGSSLSAGRPPYYGKFRGVVSANADPNELGRVRARVPDVFGEEESGWALPAAPYAGDGVGFFLIPPVGASVWFEFENGDPDYPIWTGCFWGSASQVPAAPASPDLKVIKTKTATITIKDPDQHPQQGSVTIETAAGMKIVMDSSGIQVDAGTGTLKLNGTQVSVNNGALEVV
jgi:uncharacterized protein involved in type VI secretion and phage assembly